jgi:hypothetical protein
VAVDGRITSVYANTISDIQEHIKWGSTGTDITSKMFGINKYVTF